MSITDERLKQIEELEAKIEEKKTWIEEKKNELEEKLAIVDDVPDDLKEMMSQSASRSTENRNKGGTVEIDESATRDEEIIKELNDAIQNAEEELEKLEKEKKDLEDYVKGK